MPSVRPVQRGGEPLPRHVRIGVALAVASIALSSVMSCSFGNSRGSSVHYKTVRPDSINSLRDAARISGVPFTRLMFGIESCADDGQGNSYRATITGEYPGGSSLGGSRALVAGWQRKLVASGWSSNSGAITHNGVVLAKGDQQLEFLYVDPAAVDPVPSFTYSGPCHPLDGNPDSAPGTVEDVTAEVIG